MEVKNIYLSDDDADDRLFFKSAFEEVCSEHTLTIFDNNIDLLRHLKQAASQVPDLLFIDLNMPSLNGIECVSAIREQLHLQDVPVIIYSTINSEMFVEEVHALGAAHFIRKPYDYFELINLIKHVVDLDLSTQAGQIPLDEFVISYNSIKKQVK